MSGGEGGAFVVQPSKAMTQTFQRPSTFKTKGTVSKLRLIRGTEAPPLELPNDDPYIVKGVMSFNVDGADNVEAVAEIGKRGVDYAPGTFTAQGSFVCFFQKEYFNRIIGDLLSLSFNDEGERFFAEVHYVNGFFLTVPILITNRSDSINPQNVNQVNFNFVCTDVPDYTNLAIRNVPPSAPMNLEGEIGDDNLVAFGVDPSVAENSAITGYGLRYRNVNSRGVRSSWEDYAGTFTLESNRQTSTTTVNQIGPTNQSVEAQAYATSAVGRSPYSNTWFAAAAPRVMYSVSSSKEIVPNILSYDAPFQLGREIQEWEGRFKADSEAWSAATAINGLANLAKTAAQTDGTYQMQIRVQFTDGSYSYWNDSGDIVIG